MASIPSEDKIIVATRTGEKLGNYKKQLLACNQAASCSWLVHLGWFKVQDSSAPLILFASGVGITPIRAMAMKLTSRWK